MRTKIYLLSLLFGFLFLGSSCNDDTPPPPTIEIDSVSVECLPYNTVPSDFFIKGSATLNPQEKKVVEAGFLADAVTSNPRLLVYDFNPLSNIRLIPCKLIGNKISFDEERYSSIQGVNGFSSYNGRAYFRAYMILSDGSIVYSDIIEAKVVVRN